MKFESGPHIRVGDLLFWSKYADMTSQTPKVHEYVGICTGRQSGIVHLINTEGRAQKLNEVYLVTPSKTGVDSGF